MMELRNSRAESPTLDQSQPILKTDVDLPKIPADVGNAGGGGEVVKRKRGRPPRVQANQPAAKKSKEEDEDEDVCFICFDGGSLVLCDRRGCPKAYHPSCIKRDEAFFRSKAKWNCGWHICSMCEKTAYHMCYTCTYSLCKGCIRQSDYVCVRGDKGFCTVCMKTIMLIEKSGDATAQVDFDDKTSWEYLFKVYWVYTKAKLSLTLDELTQAKNPFKLTSIEPPPIVSHTNHIVRRSITSELSIANQEANESKRRKTNEQTNGPVNDPSVNGPKEWASKELLDLVAHMKNGDTSVLSQFDVQALLLEYIKRNNLRDPRKKTQIICDLRLMNLFGKPRVGHIEMLKLLESHFLVKQDVNKDTPNTTAKQVDTVTEIKTEKTVVVGTKERRNQRKGGKRVQNKLDEYAAIDVHNMNLIYLRRNLMESIIEDKEKFSEKVVGSIVQIRISGSDQKDDMYRLVQVVGTVKVDVPYKVGEKLVDIMLEVLNLDKKETVSIGTISNQELSEDECRRLRESIRCGLVRCFTVGEIQEKAMALQSVLLDDRIKAEMLRLNQLRDRASEKGQKKNVRECVKKLKILNTLEERERRLREIPEIHSDPKMNPDYESDDTEEYFNNEHGEHSKPNFPWVSGTNTISPTKKDDDSVNHPTNSSTVASVNVDSSKSNTGIDVNGSIKVQNEADCNGSNVLKCNHEAAVSSSSSSHIVSESTPSSVTMTNNRSVNDDMWHYRDPSGNVQGPFSILQLQKWDTSGYFPVDMRIWAGREADSLLLKNVLQDHFHSFNGPVPENKAVPLSTVNLEKIPDDLNRVPSSVDSLTKSTEQFGIQNMPDINQHVSSGFTVADAAPVVLPSPLKMETRENPKIQDSKPKEQLVKDPRIQNVPDINQHVTSVFTVADVATVDLPTPLKKKESRKKKKLHEKSKLSVQDSGTQNIPVINQQVSSVENQKNLDFRAKEQSKFLVQDSGTQNMPVINQHVSSVENQKNLDFRAKEQSKFLVQDSGIQNMPVINQHVSSVENQKNLDFRAKEQSNFVVQDSGTQNISGINQHVSSGFTIDNQEKHDFGAKEQLKQLVQDSGIQNMPDINQQVSSVFTVTDTALVNSPSPFKKKERRKNKKVHDSQANEQSKLLVQDSSTQNMSGINQHVSSVFTVTDTSRVDLPSPLQIQKKHDYGTKEQSKLLVQDSGMSDINHHVSSVFNASFVDLQSPLPKKETVEKQKTHEAKVNEQSKLLDQDSGFQNMPDINQHIPSVFTVADANLVDLPKKETREKQEIRDPGVEKDQSKLLVQDSVNPPSWSTTLSLVVGGTQLSQPGDEWGRYPTPTMDHQVATTNTAIDQITHMPSWHGLGETIEFSTLAEESVSDLLAEVDAMESRNCVPSPTSRRNSFLEDLFNGSMDDFSPTTDQGTRSDGFSSAADMHLNHQSTGLQFSFGLETKPTCAVSIPQASVSDNIGFKWAEMSSSVLNPARQDMFDLNDSTRAEADEGEREAVIEEKSTTRETVIEEKSTPRDMVMEETRVGRKSKEKESVENMKTETARAKIVSGFAVADEEEGEFIQPEAAPPPPPPPPPPASLPLPPLLPLPRQPLLPTPTIGLDAVDSRRAGSEKRSQGTASTGRVHSQTGGSRSGNVGRDSHHRRHGGDRYHSNSKSPRERSHHVEDSGYSRSSSKASWSRQSSFGSSGGSGGGGGGGGSGYSRPPSKGQRVCRYYESGRCIKGSACNYLHPQER